MRTSLRIYFKSPFTFLIALWLYVMLFAITITGWWPLAVVMAWIASPVIFSFLRVALEEEPFRTVKSTRSQAWSFLFGDTIVLPAAFGFTAHAWLDYEVQPPVAFWPWFIGCFMVGVVCGVVFHTAERSAYTVRGHALSLNSPTKIFHDLATYPSIAGALLFTALPLLWGWSWHTWAVIGCLLLWGLLGLRDSHHGELIPWGHPEWHRD